MISIQRYCWKLIHTSSKASICEESEQLKQDGGSSLGSGEGGWTVFPKETPGEKNMGIETAPV